jgi:hypothetical protein
MSVWSGRNRKVVVSLSQDFFFQPALTLSRPRRLPKASTLGSHSSNDW